MTKKIAIFGAWFELLFELLIILNYFLLIF